MKDIHEDSKSLEELYVQPSRKKGFLTFIVLFPLFLACAAAAVYIFKAEEDPFGALIAVGFALFFAYLSFTSLRSTLRGHSYLILKQDRFEECLRGSIRTHRWDEVSDFGVFEHRYGIFTFRSVVTYDVLSDESSRANSNRRLMGVSESLANTYTLSSEQLKKRMSFFRERALNSNERR